MKLLKIIDGFVTNSSSDHATFLIALRKGKDLKEVIDRIGTPNHLTPDFYDFSDDLESIEGIVDDFEIEIEHLTDEYDILINDITTWISDPNEYYEIPDEELKALIMMADSLEEQGGDDLIVLFFSESAM